MNCFNSSMHELGFNNLGIDDSVPNKPRYITHNHINYCLRQVYNNLFKPDKPLFNNQKSIIDYDNNELLQELANIFIDICTMYNKSLGLMSFGFMIGCDYTTLLRWVNDQESNPTRYKIIKSIQETHKVMHIGLLNESPVGAMATANNDNETGLNWSKNNAPTVTTKEVYYLPATRADKLGLEKLENEL